MPPDTDHLQATRRLTVGMPHMVPGQLSEVELLKFAGDLQWQSMGAALKTPPHQLVNDAGERLYASFINIEAHFGDGCLAQFQEGDELHLSSRTAFFAKQFVEGWVLLGTDQAEVSEAAAASHDKGKLDEQSVPRLYMTNALISREGSNTKLKTSRPDNVQALDLAELRDRPAGMVEHAQVQSSGHIAHALCHHGATPLKLSSAEPIAYEIQPDGDLNGAGLVYFARYIAMMNHAERETLRRRMHAPFSTQLSACLSTRSRRTFYFANAEPADTVEICCKAWLLEAQPARDVTTTRMATFLFDYQLYRRSDGVLMASSLAERCLIVPNRQKSLAAEATRFIAGLG